MTGHIPKGAGAEIIPATPGECVIHTLLEGPEWSGSEPEVPIHIRRHGILTHGPVYSLRPNWTIRPDMEFTGRSNDTGLNDFDGPAKAIAGAALVAHLGSKFFLVGHAAHFTRFPD